VRPPGRGDEGTATAELAVCLPALALMLVVGLGALSVVRDQIECVAAAREVAIAVARGESPPPVAAAVVEISVDGDVVRVVVRRHRSLGALPGIDISATAVAAVEPEFRPLALPP
jgi:hypothetical protein